MNGLDDIAIFVKVVQAGSFTKAAKALNMPNTTVSYKVAALEKRLGVTLIQRTTRKLNITQAGEAYFRRCVLALAEIEAAEEELSSSQKEPKGTLRITSAVDVAQSLVPLMVSTYLKKYPQIKVELTVTNRLVDLVGEGIDLAFRAGNLSDSSMKVRKITSSRLGFWASPAYLKKAGKLKKIEDLKKHQFIEFNHFRHKKIAMTNGKNKFLLSCPSQIAVDDFATIKTFLLQGAGVALLPHYLCFEEVEKGRLVRVLPQWYWESGNFSIVYPAQKFVAPKVAAFIEVAVEVAKACKV